MSDYFCLTFECAVDGHYCPTMQCTKEMRKLFTAAKKLKQPQENFRKPKIKY